jgi:hypothetical protein
MTDSVRRRRSRWAGGCHAMECDKSRHNSMLGAVSDTPYTPRCSARRPGWLTRACWDDPGARCSSPWLLATWSATGENHGGSTDQRINGSADCLSRRVALCFADGCDDLCALEVTRRVVSLCRQREQRLAKSENRRFKSPKGFRASLR